MGFMACLYGYIAVLTPAQVPSCTWGVLRSSAPSIQGPKTHFWDKEVILKRQLTAIYTHSCTIVYTSVRKILFLTLLNPFFKAVMACLYGYIAVRPPAQVPIPPKHSLGLAPLLMWVHCFARKNHPQDNLLFAQCTWGVLRSSVPSIQDPKTHFWDKEVILLDNYLQIFSLAYFFIRGGSKVFDSCLTKIIFLKQLWHVCTA